MIKGNYSVDKDSGAVIFHRSPELIELVKVQKNLDELNLKIELLTSKINQILDALERS